MKYLFIFLALVKLSFAQNLSEDVIKYINKQIDKLLQDHPLRDEDDLKLNLDFNHERVLLQNAKFNNTNNVEEGSEVHAQYSMSKFSNFVTNYEEIARQLTLAIEELDNLLLKKNLALSTKYEALSLKMRLQNCRNIKEAERALKRYKKFKQESLQTENSNLSEEQQKGLEEIVQLLKKLSLYEKPKMQHGIQQLKQHPDNVTTLTDILKKVREQFEDYKKYEAYVVELLEKFFE